MQRRIQKIRMSLHYLIGFATIFPIKADRFDGIDALGDRLMPVMAPIKDHIGTIPDVAADHNRSVDDGRSGEASGDCQWSNC
ncbi:MAG: hypothetical protein ACR2RE_09220 [Geminicoccaceae bacterium]